MLFVNNVKIDDSIIQAEMERLRPEYQRVFSNQTAKKQEEQLLEWAQENVIEQYLLKKTASGDDYSVTEKDVTQKLKELIESHGGEESFFRQFNLSKDDESKLRSDVEHQLRNKNLISMICEDISVPTVAEAHNFYKQNTNDFLQPEQVRAAHIVKHVDSEHSQAQAFKEIRDIQNQLQTGGTFEELADKISDCAGNGGDLGYFARGQMVPEFEEVVFNLKPNEISDIIRTGYGYHIAKLYDRKQGEMVPFENVKDRIMEHLLEEAKQKKIEIFVDKLKEKAIIRTE